MSDDVQNPQQRPASIGDSTDDELACLRSRADDALPAYPGDVERLMTVPAPTMLRVLAAIDAARTEAAKLAMEVAALRLPKFTGSPRHANIGNPPCDPTEDHNHPADCADSDYVGLRSAQSDWSNPMTPKQRLELLRDCIDNALEMALETATLAGNEQDAKLYEGARKALIELHDYADEACDEAEGSDQ